MSVLMGGFLLLPCVGSFLWGCFFLFNVLVFLFVWISFCLEDRISTGTVFG